MKMRPCRVQGRGVAVGNRLPSGGDQIMTPGATEFWGAPDGPPCPAGWSGQGRSARPEGVNFLLARGRGVLGAMVLEGPLGSTTSLGAAKMWPVGMVQGYAQPGGLISWRLGRHGPGGLSCWPNRPRGGRSVCMWPGGMAKRSAVRLAEFTAYHKSRFWELSLLSHHITQGGQGMVGRYGPEVYTVRRAEFRAYRTSRFREFAPDVPPHHTGSVWMWPEGIVQRCAVRRAEFMAYRR